jgi:hypothetical protein
MPEIETDPHRATSPEGIASPAESKQQPQQPGDWKTLSEAEFVRVEERLGADQLFFPFEIAFARTRLANARQYFQAGVPGAAWYEFRDLLLRLNRVRTDQNSFLVCQPILRKRVSD